MFAIPAPPRRWGKRLSKLVNRVMANPARNGTERRRAPRAQVQDDGLFHYVISAEQEDEIRECFLVDKLRPYTKTLEESDFVARHGEQASPDAAADKAELQSNDTKRTSSDSDSENDEIPCQEDDIDDDDDFHGAGFVIVPLPGEACADAAPSKDDGAEQDKKRDRQVPNGCAVCLSAFDAGDKVTWSSNEDCNHIFHQACILDWLNASGRRNLRRRRRQDQMEGVLNYANDPLQKITRFPMPCPCCRAVFIVDTDKKEALSDRTCSTTASAEALGDISTTTASTETSGEISSTASTETSGDLSADTSEPSAVETVVSTETLEADTALASSDINSASPSEDESNEAPETIGAAV